MGEIADMLVDQMIEHSMWKPWRPKPPRCMHCGSKDVFWLPRNGRRYELTNLDGSVHNCNTPEGFEDLTCVAG